MQRSRRTATAKGGLWTDAPPLWRSVMRDIGHVRLDLVRHKLESASEGEMKSLRVYPWGFLGSAVKAAATAAASQRRALLSLVEVALLRGISPDEQTHGLGRTLHDGAEPLICIAAYFGVVDVLELLFAASVNRDVVNGRGDSPEECALRNGQNGALRLLLEHAPRFTDGRATSLTLLPLSLERRNADATRALVAHGLRLTDFDLSCLSKGHRSLTADERYLAALAGGPSWTGKGHWSFPTTDRRTINLLTAVARRGGLPVALPLELWMLVLSNVERGWFAGRKYLPNGRPWANVLPQNVLS